MKFFCEEIKIDYQALAAIFGTNAADDEEKSYQEPYEAQYSYIDINGNKLELNISIYEPSIYVWLKRPVKENERKYGLPNQAYFPLFRIVIHEIKLVICDVKNRIITLFQCNNSIVVKIYFQPFIHIRVKSGIKE